MARYQSFDLPDRRGAVPSRIAALRSSLPALDAEALLIPRSDAYLGEFVAPGEERLAWATGFTGSAGTCLLLADRAVLFLDGRYLEQGRLQTDPETFEIVDVRRTPPSAWIRETVPTLRIALDPWQHSVASVRRLKQAGAELRLLESNPVDALWTDRPRVPASPVRQHPVELAGETCLEKRRRIARSLARRNAAGALLANPESVCWLFNLRGADAPHTPLVHARAVIRSNGDAELLVDPERIPEDMRAGFGDGVTLRRPEETGAALARLRGERLAIDPASTPEALRRLAVSSNACVVEAQDPVAVPKARKNPAEMRGLRHAHRLDGAAMANFLAWLDRSIPARDLTEIDVAEELERQRVRSGELNEISFDTIAAAGPHAALPHYRVSRASNRALRRGEVLLVDSGGQYRTGTTDVTRTLGVGDLPDDARGAYTAVLRAMIRLSTLEFPEYATGVALDAIARETLWREGLDYDHGTGHGVGACLGVHEGPFSLSPHSAAPALVTGLVLSNEPGVYVPGRFGVRIENLLALRERAPSEGGTPARLAFETLTLVPIDLRPVLLGRLSPSERAWLDGYHDRVRAEISPMVGADTRAWLERACRPLS